MTPIDPERLEALAETGLLDTPPEVGFDRITQLASQLIGSPVSLISLVDADRQFFKSAVGLPEPWNSLRETPLSHSFCQHVVATGAPLIIEDARSDALLRGNLAIRDLGVIAYLGVPLKTSDGHVLGALCAIESKPRTWSARDTDSLTQFASIVMDEIDLRDEIKKRRAIEEHQQFLISELSHRVKNTLALVDSIVGLCVRTAPDPASLGATLRARIQSLAATHALAVDHSKETIELGEIVKAEIKPLKNSNVTFDGPKVSLSSNDALYLSMGLHELTTNSVKYGALSVAGGRVDVRWKIDHTRLVLHWIESNGPPVCKPTRTGFGTLLFDRILGQQLRGTVSRAFDAGGVSATFDLDCLS